MKKITISRENIQKIKDQYPSLKPWSDTHALSLYKKIQEHQLITEFLSTISPQKTSEQLSSQLGDANLVGYDYTTDPGHLQIQVKIFTKEFADKLVKFMDKFGWYPSFIYDYEGLKEYTGKFSSKFNDNLNRENVIIVFEAKYDEEVDLSDEPYLYHVAPDTVYNKIKLIGLTPKNKGKLANHPGRIYLIAGENKGVFNQMLFQLWDASSNKDLINKMYVLQINNSQLKNHKFFKDPNFNIEGVDAIYTYQNIPPSAITPVFQVDVKNFK
jgi:hypothetical protein